ncbi:n6-adenine-specific [Cystoisospora suis]|uniref:N6-adenine-specific n=1 Tax=Cystoisospora suis TaxID=483139 RepID=A0A2C6KJ93_9APIC|nr:n6-adenine-specific [Cystoisospora suis]
MTERSRVIRASVEEFLLAPHRFFPLHDFPRFLFRQANRMKEAQTLHASLSLDEPTEMGRSYQREDMDELDRRRSSEDSTRSSGVQRMIEKLRDDILEKEYEYRGDTKKEKKRVVSTHLFDLVLMTPPYTTVVYKDLIQLLLNCSVIRDDSLVVIEYPKEIGCLPRLIRSETTSAALIGLRNRLYGRTCVGVYVKQKVYLTPRKKEFTSLQPRETGRQGQRSQENTDLTDCMQALNGEEMKTDSGSNRRVLEERDVPAKDEKEYDGKQYKRKNITHLNETLLPETSYWYGQEKPSEFVPLGLHRKQLLSEGWIERRGVERKNE